MAHKTPPKPVKPTATEEADLKESAQPASNHTPLKRLLLAKSPRGRVLAAGALVAVALVTLFSIPYTRYGLLGQIFKRSIILQVTDSRTHKPVSDAPLTLGHQKLKTDAKGEVKLASVPVGGWQVVVNKKYYNLVSTTIMVPLFAKTQTYKLEVVAIGNQVTVKLINKITGRPLAKANIAALGTTATTDTSGEAVIVLPADSSKQPGAAKASGYNDLALSIQNTESLTAANTFALTPAGKIYFLSKRTGTINVMKSDLDGSNPQVVVAGTGRESDTDTVLLASRDWKYLALKATRDSDQAKLYIINTATDKLDTMDEGKATFTPVGWSDHYFVYSVLRSDVQYWQPKQAALKSYDADKDSLRTLDETAAEGTSQYDYGVEVLGSVYLINNVAIYTKGWNGQMYHLADKKIVVYSTKLADGTKQTLNDFPQLANNNTQDITSRPYGAKGVAYQISSWNGSQTVFSYLEFEDGKVSTAADINAEVFGKPYTGYYIQSPSDKQTFWYDPRDGKNTLFKGDDEGKNEKVLADLSEFTPYGWYTDDYLLVSKAGSELYIAPADFSTAPLKITDYHKPNFNSIGYGGGYGGGF